MKAKLIKSVYPGSIIRVENESGIRLEAYLIRSQVVDFPPRREPAEQLLKMPVAG